MTGAVKEWLVKYSIWRSGSKGPPGPTGGTGAPGARGSQWTTGSGVPVAAALVGDMYLNTANADVYRHNGTAWVLQTNIRGTAGTNGTNGTNGINAAYFDSGGAVASPKVWSGVVLTDGNGRWSVNYSNAGFTTPPVIEATVVGAGLNASDTRNASLSAAPTATGAAGIATAPALSVLGLITVQLAAANTPVHVTATGR